MKFIVFGAAILAAAPAVAQDPSVRGAAFDGPRVEARIGWDRPTLRATVTDETGSISRSSGKSGVGYGGEIGYDAALDGVVVGAYAGLEESSVKTCGEVYGEDRACLRAGRTIAAGARVGVLADDSLLLYAKGGYSSGRVSLDYQDFEMILADASDSLDFDGFHLGAGVEGTLKGGVYGRLEYVYTQYGERSARIDDFRASLKPKRHQVVYSLGYRF